MIEIKSNELIENENICKIIKLGHFMFEMAIQIPLSSRLQAIKSPIISLYKSMV